MYISYFVDKKNGVEFSLQSTRDGEDWKRAFLSKPIPFGGLI